MGQEERGGGGKDIDTKALGGGRKKREEKSGQKKISSIFLEVVRNIFFCNIFLSEKYKFALFVW